MNKMLFDMFNCYTTHETGASYLVLEPDSPGDVLIYNYQVEMIAANPKECVVSPQIQRKDNELKFCYDISSKTLLSEYLKNKKLTKREFIDLLYRITEVLAQSRKLLLNERNFITHEDFIFMDTKSGLPCILYLPVRSNENQGAPFKDFVLTLITRMASIEIKVGDNFLQRIIESVKSPEFGAASLLKLLNDIRYKNVASLQTFDNGGQQIDTGVLKNLESPKEPWHLFKEEEGIDEKELRYKDRKAGPESGKFNIRTILSAIISQSALVVFALAAESTMKAKGVETDKRYIAIGVFVLVVDLLLFKYLIFARKGKNQIQVEEVPDKAKAGDMGNIPGNLEADNWLPNMFSQKFSNEVVLSHSESAAGENCEEQEKEAGKEENAHLVRTPAADETVLLVTEQRNRAFLVRVQDDTSEKVEIDSRSFIVGRSSEAANLIINEKAVGRIHAEIVYKDDRYFITDKDSRNGTYVNDIRLEAGQEYELKDNDTLTFSNVAYRFSMS